MRDKPKARNEIAKDLRSPKYRKRVIPDKRRAKAKRACRVKE